MSFDIKDMQNISLEILKYFADICEKNNIRYYLAYGTLLGAIRHKGFIPWDDDIDVLIPREDYYRLLEVMKEEPHEYYKVVSCDVNSKFTAPLPKLIDSRTIVVQKYGFIERVPLGVYIDLFILDGLGDTYQEAVKHYKKGDLILKKWLRADTMLFPNNSKNIVKDILRWLRNSPNKVMGISYYLNRLKQHCEQKKYDQCNYVASLSLPSNDA